ncbi:hypothetical protein BDV10DRAFT_87469 [Aspergillus recurvatus]
MNLSHDMVWVSDKMTLGTSWPSINRIKTNLGLSFTCYSRVRRPTPYFVLDLLLMQAMIGMSEAFPAQVLPGPTVSFDAPLFIKTDYQALLPSQTQTRRCDCRRLKYMSESFLPRTSASMERRPPDLLNFPGEMPHSDEKAEDPESARELDCDSGFRRLPKQHPYGVEDE